MNELLKKMRLIMLTVTLLIGLIGGYRLRAPSMYWSADEIDLYTDAAKQASAKGTVIAYGGGFDSEEHFKILVDRAVAATGKSDPKLVFLPTGARDNTAGYEDEQLAWFRSAGLEPDVLLVTKTSAEDIAAKLAGADIIYETGGNLDFLMIHWTEKGVVDEVKKAFDRGAVLMGVSTGAMCWAARGWDDFGEPTQRVIGDFPFWGEDNAYVFREATGVIPFCVCPHFDNVGWRAYSFEAIKLDIPSLCLENGAAIVYHDGAYEVISDPDTPLRTAYLFVPDKNIVMLDVRMNSAIAACADGEQRVLNSKG